MLIFIPMAGLSSRFSMAGYAQPKYMLPLWGRPVFDHALTSFSAYFEEARFVFCALDNPGIVDFVRGRCKHLRIQHFDLVKLDEVTRGQAETVDLGLAGLENEQGSPLVIFNIDSIRPNFHLDERYTGTSYLEVFKGEGDGWSFVVEDPAHPGRAIEVKEKQRVSRWCSNGLYVFADITTFREAYRAELADPSQSINEHYVAPVYNQLIRRGWPVGIRKLLPTETLFSGTPAEYERLRIASYPEALSS